MIDRPWLDFYGTVPASLAYPETTLFEALAEAAARYPDHTALEFMGAETSYRTLVDEIEACARALRSLGIREGDRVTICLPNVPQAVVMFYAVNRIGAMSNMVHPLSSEGEIEFFLTESDSVAAITLDAFYGKFAAVRERTRLRYLIVTSVADKLKPVTALAFRLTKGRKIPRVPRSAGVIPWGEFLAGGAPYSLSTQGDHAPDDPAVILYSGGTSGTTKGILLTDRNFNALALQTAAMGDCLLPGHSMLAILPVFHGFGLGICIHTMLVHGCRSLLVPTFNAKIFADLLRKKQPNYIAGVPTLYEALLRNPSLKNTDLSCLEGVFCGGDSLSIELKKKVDAFLKLHGASVEIREGYGMTESVTASCLTPKHHAREGSIGLPFPDMLYKIVRPGTQETVPYGTDGEICVSGPTVMIGYLGNPKETAHTLQIHPDGRTWLHTGDLGMMDAEGFVYFRQRLKRMIISSGYSIYPSQLENVIDAHDAVLMSTVIGVDDPYKIQKVKAFVVLKPHIAPSEEIKRSIREHCEKNIAKYAMPYAFEYRESLPKTLVGKVAYTVLEAEEKEKEAKQRKRNEGDGA